MKLLMFSSLNGEWNGYARFNALLYKLKKEGHYIIAVVPPKALDILSEADEYITISNKYLDSKKENYPYLSDLEDKEESTFHSLALEYIYEQYPDYTVIEFDRYILEADGKELFSWFTCPEGGYNKVLKRDWQLLIDYVKEKAQYPTKENYDKIKKRYGHLFKGKTYVLITRGNKVKTPDLYNTDYATPDLISHIKSWKDINIINIGFPAVYYEGCTEIKAPLSHGDMMSLFYLSNGVIMNGNAGGYCCNILCNTDIFMIGEDWAMSIPEIRLSISDHRKLFTKYMYLDTAKYYNNKYKETHALLKKHKKTTKNIFAPKKPIHVINV